MSCENHKKKVAGISDMKELAERIGDLHYEVLSDFMYALKAKIFKDAKKDMAVGRVKLAGSLLEANFCLHDAAVHILKAWKISSPYMPKSRAKKLRSQGKTIRQIAKELGYKHPGSISHLLK